MFKRLVAPSLSVVALASALLLPLQAFADGEWCEDEPDIVSASGVHTEVAVKVHAPASHIVTDLNIFTEGGAFLLPSPLGAFPQKNVLIDAGPAHTLQYRVLVVDPKDQGAEVVVTANGVEVAHGTVNHEVSGSLSN